jgi:hypothetical protein
MFLKPYGVHNIFFCQMFWFVCLFVCLFVFPIVFNATFNNVSVISWRSVLLVEESGEPGENHKSVANHRQTLPHNVVHLTLIEIRTHNISGIGTDCIGSCKSNYHDGPLGVLV